MMINRMFPVCILRILTILLFCMGHKAVANDSPDQIMSLQAPTISASEWSAYAGRFLSENGRIIDDANGNISHSEGQGYGLLLAVLADRRADFELIWRFTETELLIRRDGLAAWKWDPIARPHITDTNNASDGDILIAYALALAAHKWQNEIYWDKAATIAVSILKKQVIEHNGQTILLPAMRGFSPEERSDGPIVNLSYWIFEALPVLNQLYPSTLWEKLGKDGVELLGEARFGSKGLPADWTSIEGKPRPASGFPDEFGYNSLRIVLYLVRAGSGKDVITQQLAKAMRGADGDVELVKLSSGKSTASLSDAGYKVIPELADCIQSGTRLSPALSTFAPTSYYPSTLHLLALSFARQNHPECL